MLMLIGSDLTKDSKVYDLPRKRLNYDLQILQHSSIFV